MFKISSCYSIIYQTEQISVSPVHHVCFPEKLSCRRDCLVSSTDTSPVPHSLISHLHSHIQLWNWEMSGLASCTEHSDS